MNKILRYASLVVAPILLASLVVFLTWLVFDNVAMLWGS